MRKAPKKPGTEGAYLSTIKTESDKTVAKKNVNGEKPKVLSLKPGVRQAVSSLLIQSQMTRSYTLKESKDIARKFSDLINTCNNVAGHNNNIQNQQVLYANNE